MGPSRRLEVVGGVSECCHRGKSFDFPIFAHIILCICCCGSPSWEKQKYDKVILVVLMLKNMKMMMMMNNTRGGCGWGDRWRCSKLCGATLLVSFRLIFDMIKSEGWLGPGPDSGALLGSSEQRKRVWGWSWMEVGNAVPWEIGAERIDVRRKWSNGKGKVVTPSVGGRPGAGGTKRELHYPSKVWNRFTIQVISKH